MQTRSVVAASVCGRVDPLLRRASAAKTSVRVKRVVENFNFPLSKRLVFCDNLGILSAAVSGRSSVLDVDSLLTGLHLLLTSLRVTSWWELVDTHANPADGGSRQGTSCKLAKRLGTPLEWVKFSLCAGLHRGR